MRWFKLTLVNRTILRAIRFIVSICPKNNNTKDAVDLTYVS